MQTFTIQALGTHRRIQYEGTDADHHETIQHMILAFEQKYSRFLAWSLISQLNAQKSLLIDETDEEFLELIRIWQDAFEKTWWIFSPFVWSILEQNWYDAQYSFTPSNISTPSESELNISWKTITLSEHSSYDMGWYGKWYVIDKIANYLTDQHISYWIIDGWGDIRTHSDEHLFWPLWIPHPTQQDLLIAERSVTSWAITTSSALHRSRGDTHHLIDPHTWLASETDIVSVSVLADRACQADIASTTLFVAGLERLESLAHTLWVQYLILLQNNTIVSSKDIPWLEVYIA